MLRVKLNLSRFPGEKTTDEAGTMKRHDGLWSYTFHTVAYILSAIGRTHSGCVSLWRTVSFLPLALCLCFKLFFLCRYSDSFRQLSCDLRSDKSLKLTYLFYKKRILLISSVLGLYQYTCVRVYHSVIIDRLLMCGLEKANIGELVCELKLQREKADCTHTVLHLVLHSSYRLDSILQVLNNYRTLF